MPSINRVEPYSALADVYQAAGLADYSAALAPRLLNLAFEMEWTGRSLLDLACGTGELACWFSEQGFRVTGVDISPLMLRPATARAQEGGLSADFVAADMRAYRPDSHVELVTCLGGSLNYVPKLSDLEAVFRLAHAALGKDKLFVFDVFTIQGLANYQDTERVAFDNGSDILILEQDAFNYETLLLTRRYTILRYGDRSGWQRAEEVHTLRGYPLQAIVSTLVKAGLKVVRTMTRDFALMESHQEADAVIIVAIPEG